MRKLYLLLVALVPIVALNAQQLLNSGFEDWSVSGKPDHWSTIEAQFPIIGTFSLGVDNLTKSTIRHSGDAALKISASNLNPSVESGLKTISGLSDSVIDLIKNKIPGFATNGVIDLTAMFDLLLPFLSSGDLDINNLDLNTLPNLVTGGLPVASGNKPIRVSGFARVANPDSAIYAIVAVAYNGTGASRTIVGIGAADAADSSAFENFSADIIYTVNDSVSVDELAVMLVVFSTSTITPNPYPYMLVDDLTVEYTVAINDVLYSSTMGVYPNPAKDIINIQVANPEIPYEVQLSDLLGKVVLTAHSQATINVSQLTKGVYIAKLKQGNKERTQKIVIQ